MQFFSYKNNNNISELFVESAAISSIAKQVGTPFYCYSKQAIIENYQQFVKSFALHHLTNYKICYAIKANANLHLVEILAGLGAGVDAVSAGEIFRALKAGIKPDKIVFAGVGKTAQDITFALQNQVNDFSVESIDEMFLLNEIATKLNKKVKFSLRVNPNVDANTHHKISTGRKNDKFGIDIDLAKEVYVMASKLPALEIYGISTHIGSQITSLEPFEIAFSKVRELCLFLQKQGYNIQNLDFGGGIGIDYQNNPTINIADYINLLQQTTLGLGVSITIAPGRAIVGDAGLLVVKTLFCKETANKSFVIIDGAINDLMRPGLYGSYHEVLPIIKKFGPKATFDFAGPVCETTDILASDRQIVVPDNGDLFALCSAGAYGSSMSNQYNCRPLVPEVLVDNDKFLVIRKRPTFAEMIELENL
jgi:diaminopimelate decarboxylase